MVYMAVGSLQYVTEPLHAELLALIQVVQIFATDCQVLMRAIKSNSYELWQLGALFCEAKFQLHNIPAHVLAGLGADGGQNFRQVLAWQPTSAVTHLMSGVPADES